MHFLPYDVVSVRDAYRYKAARNSVLTPIFGTWWRKYEVPEAMSKLREFWQHRLYYWQKAGLSRLAKPSKAIVYASNCPPFGVTTENTARVCNWMLCPFCYARRNTLTAFMRLEMALYGSYDGKAPLRMPDVSLYWFCSSDSMISDKPDIAPDDHRKRLLRYFGEVLLRKDRHCEKNVLKPLGGVIFHRIVPDVEDPTKCLFQRSGIFICEDDLVHQRKRKCKPDTNHHESGVLEPTRKNLYKAARNVFSYPRSWLDLEPSDIELYLNAMRRLRMLSCFGCVTQKQVKGIANESLEAKEEASEA